MIVSPATEELGFGEKPLSISSCIFSNQPNELQSSLQIRPLKRQCQYKARRRSNIPLLIKRIGKDKKQAKRKAPNRGKIGVRGRPSKKLLDQLFGPHQSCLAGEVKLQNEVSTLQHEMQTANKKLQATTRELKAANQELDFLRQQLLQKANEPILSLKVKPTVDVLRDLKLEFRAPHVFSALLLRAETQPDVHEVIAKLEATRTAIGSIRTQRRLAVLSLNENSEENICNTIVSNRSERTFYDNRVVIFGKNCFRCLTDRMAFYANVTLDLTESTVICAFADGKFSDSPRGWSQIFELRLAIERPSPNSPQQIQQRTVTFAFALLKGTREDDYLAFFEAAKRWGCPTPPVFLSDFEIAIGKAARQVWPKVQLRGCFFHYTANLRQTTAKLVRWLSQRPTQGILNLLIVAPFLSRPQIFFHYFLKELKLEGDQLFKNIDFKLVMYVFTTYIIRFKALFKADLRALLIRTNNTCEGKNSSIARNFATRLTLSNFLDLIECNFKHDYARPWKPRPPASAYDRFFVLLQGWSETNPRFIYEFLRNCPAISTKNSVQLLSCLEKAVISQLFVPTLIDEDEVLGYLGQLSVAYRAFRERKKKERLDMREFVRQVMREDDAVLDLKKRREELWFLERSLGTEDSMESSDKHFSDSHIEHSDSSESEDRDVKDLRERIKPGEMLGESAKAFKAKNQKNGTANSDRVQNNRKEQ